MFLWIWARNQLKHFLLCTYFFEIRRINFFFFKSKCFENKKQKNGKWFFSDLFGIDIAYKRCEFFSWDAFEIHSHVFKEHNSTCGIVPFRNSMIQLFSIISYHLCNNTTAFQKDHWRCILKLLLLLLLLIISFD